MPSIGESAPLPAATPDDQELARLIREAPAEVRQLISDTLADYAAQPVWTPPPPRTVIGPPGARDCRRFIASCDVANTASCV